MKSKPVIAVSRCLLGHQVRYDGQIKSNDFILNELTAYFQFRAICPEVGIGLSVPRPPMHLVRQAGEIRAVKIDDPSIDYTQRLRDYADKMLPSLLDVKVFIFKAKSPSCGVGTTCLSSLGRTQENTSTEAKVNGIFAEQILRVLPNLMIVDESQLQTPQQRASFIQNIPQLYRKP